ncbi:Kelch repeat protein [Paecilomyces variotii No. 5]|uniref:Kelch repeat protein n=1 Tax=Byssochlamys spectabilis (strain No. 5 / NBRC 109023) TaxID=1356009 RepID=V5FWV3_BYSSN|nr:Kelch repeat protein [Paecilomyces variotii No. 5]
MLKSFVWQLKTCVPTEILGLLGPSGFLQVKQPDLESIFLVTDSHGCESSYDLGSFKKLKRLSWTGLHSKVEWLALRECFETASSQLTYLELDAVSWNRVKYHPSGIPNPEAFLVHEVLKPQPGEGRVVFPNLKYMRLSAISFKSTALQMASICCFESLRSLKLRFCPGWNEFLNHIVSSHPTIRLETLEIQSLVDYDRTFNTDETISKFIDACQGLRELCIMVPESFSDTGKIFHSILHHNDTLKNLAFHQRDIIHMDTYPLVLKRQRDVPDFSFWPARSKGCSMLHSQNPLLDLELECIGICCVPELLKTIVSPLAEKSSLKLLHVRQSGVDFDRYGNWGIAPKEAADGWTEDSDIARSSSESSSGDNRPDNITKNLHKFAQWAFGPDDPSIQRSSQTLAVVAGNVYIYGGELRPREPVDSVVYRMALDRDTDTTTNSKPIPISTTSNNPPPRVGSASTALNGKVYLFSGRGGTAMAPIEEKGSFWVFSPDENSWTQVAPRDPQLPYPVGRSYHALTNDGKETIFLHAGCPEKGRLGDLWAFNISTRQWRELPAAPKPERGGTSIAYAAGKVFRMNGFDGRTEQGGAVDVFRLDRNVWETVTYQPDGVSGPGPRSVSCLLAVEIQGKAKLVTMFGERDPSSLGHQGAGKMLADVWVFDVESKTWTEIQTEGSDAPEARGWFDADVVTGELSGSSIIVHGGLAESNERLGDVWRLQF